MMTIMVLQLIVDFSTHRCDMKAIKDVFAKHQDDIDRFDIGVGFLLALISTNGFVIEPVFFTPDAMAELHKEVVEDSVLKSIKGFPENLEAREATARIRAELLDLFEQVGGVHLQIGKAYPYRSGLRTESWQLLEAVKDSVDPQRRVNPGSLGLD